ncbi:MAG: hypothetical protein M0R40_08510, partial [Firmicutes bacterium]|nr:hypothetical protein [Bacillota bacterium]
LSSNYAFVIDADVHSSGFENRLSVKAFTFDGEVVIFTGATRIDLIEEDYYSGTRTILRTYRDSGTWGYGFEDLKYKIETATVITFDVNSQGELSRIALPGSRLGEEGVNYFSEYTSGSAFNYRGNDGSIRAGNRTVDISKDTVIMIAGKIAPNSDFEDDDDYNLLSLSMLGSEDIFENFTTTIYNVNKYGVAGLVVVNGQINMAGMTDGLAMVTSISEIENINRLTVLQDGSLKEIDVQKDKNAPTLFSLIAPKLNANGEMFSFDLIAEVAPGNVEFGSGFSNSTYLEHHYGSLTAIKNNKITVDKGYSVTENYTIPQKSNIYLCEYSMLTNACKVKPLDSVNAFEIGFDDDGNLTYTDDRGIKLNKVEVLISKCDYIVQDVIIYAFGDDSAFMQNNVVVVPAVNCSAASAVYQNDTDKNINPVLVLAQYENGRLVGTSQARKSILSGDYGIFNNILKLSPKKGDTIKAMLFDGLGNIKPLLPTDTVNVDGVADLQSAKRILSRSIDFISITEYSISIRYFENPNDNTAKTIHINKNAESFVNGAAYTGKLEDILSSFYGELYLQDLDLSSKYNKVYITHYKNLIVDCINPNTKQIHFKNSSSISYGDSFNNFLTLSDNDGNILDWSMLEENDILSTKITEGANNKTIYDFIFTRNTVEGVAERTSQEDAEFEINGNYYKVDMQNIFPDDLGFENESIFYLDAFGRIAHCEAPTSLRDYAFVIDSMVYSSNMQNKLLLKTFTYDGAVDIFTGAAKISLIEENSTGTKTKLTIYKSDGGDEATDTFGGLKAKIEAATVITFSVNSQGEINKIALPGNRLGEEGVNYFSKYTEGSAFSYRGNDGSIRVGGRAVGISNDTVIMIADKIAPYSNFQNDDDYDLLSLSVLGSEDIEENYNTTVYDVNKNGIAGLIVVSGQVNVAGAASGLAMVTNISTIRSEDGGIIDRLTVFQGRETKQIEVLEGKDTPDLFSLVAPQLSARGKLTNYGLIASVYGRMVELGSGFANTSKVDYAFGGVTAIRNNRVTIDVGSGVTESYTIPPNANIYLYDGRMTTNARKAKIVDSINIFDVEGSYYGYVYYDEQGFMLDNVQVLIRRYDGRIQDVVVFFNTTLKEGYWDLDW